jgi:hypothetical protein
MHNPVEFLTRALAHAGQAGEAYGWEDLLAAMQEVTSVTPTAEIEALLLVALRFEGRFRLTPTSGRPHRLSPEDMVKSLAIQALGKWGRRAYLAEIERIESTARSPGLASVARANARRLREALPAAESGEVQPCSSHSPVSRRGNGESQKTDEVQGGAERPAAVPGADT